MKTLALDVLLDLLDCEMLGQIDRDQKEHMKPYTIRTSQGSITVLAPSSSHAVVLGFDIFPDAETISARPA
jgi:hypothetical protein